MGLKVPLLSAALEEMSPQVHQQLAAAAEPLLANVRARLLQSVEVLFRPGTFVGDAGRVRNAALTDYERIEALERLEEGWFSRPLHGARWPLVEPELRRRAKESDTSPARELTKSVMQSIPLALRDASDETDLSEYLRQARAALANRLTDDLAGPGWRRRQVGTELALEDECDVADGLDVEYQAELSELEHSLKRLLPNLPPGQQRAVQAVLEDRPLTNAEHQALHRMRRSRSLVSRFRAISRATSVIDPLAP